MNHLSNKAQLLKAQWLKEDRKFYRKYHSDKNTMQVVNALAELIANFNKPKQETIFC